MRNKAEKLGLREVLFIRQREFLLCPKVKGIADFLFRKPEKSMRVWVKSGIGKNS